MNADPAAAAELVSWPLDPWHFALLCAAILLALALDVVAVVLISRRIARSVRMRSYTLGAVALAVAMRTGTPPASWTQRARPVTAAYRLALTARQPRPLPVAWTPPTRRDVPAVVAVPSPSAPPPPPISPGASSPALSPLATRMIRPVRPMRVDPSLFATTATDVIADAIATCRRSAGGETQ